MILNDSVGAAVYDHSNNIEPRPLSMIQNFIHHDFRDERATETLYSAKDGDKPFATRHLDDQNAMSQTSAGQTAQKFNLLRL